MLVFCAKFWRLVRSCVPLFSWCWPHRVWATTTTKPRGNWSAITEIGTRRVSGSQLWKIAAVGKIGSIFRLNGAEHLPSVLRWLTNSRISSASTTQTRIPLPPQLLSSLNNNCWTKHFVSDHYYGSSPSLWRHSSFATKTSRVDASSNSVLVAIINVIVVTVVNASSSCNRRAGQHSAAVIPARAISASHNSNDDNNETRRLYTSSRICPRKGTLRTTTLAAKLLDRMTAMSLIARGLHSSERVPCGVSLGQRLNFTTLRSMRLCHAAIESGRFQTVVGLSTAPITTIAEHIDDSMNWYYSARRLSAKCTE